MRIKNLLNTPLQLGDRRMIGAAGTRSEEREFGLPELTDRDKRRIDQGILQVVAAEEVTPIEPEKPKKTGGDK